MTQAERDRLIEMVSARTRDLLEKRRIKPYRGEWLSGKQLNDLGSTLERRGYQAARVLQAGKAERAAKAHPKEGEKARLLIDVLDCVHESGLETRLAAYMIRHLNAILNAPARKGECSL